VEERTEEHTEVLGPLAEHGAGLNIFTTLARHPEAFRSLVGWGEYVLNRSSLPPREREILILRTAFRCGNGYMWTHHIVIGQQAGLVDEEIAGLKEGADAPVWKPAEAVLIRAADELVATYTTSDPIWLALTEHYDQKQCMDVVFTIAEYAQLSMMLNTFGVQLDEGLTPDPDLPG
jgi:alkylhydroperoxidase family enzyme